MQHVLCMPHTVLSMKNLTGSAWRHARLRLLLLYCLGKLLRTVASACALRCAAAGLR